MVADESVDANGGAVVVGDVDDVSEVARQQKHQFRNSHLQLHRDEYSMGTIAMGIRCLGLQSRQDNDLVENHWDHLD